MKKQGLLFLFFVICLFPFVVHADTSSDGSLQLNPSVITNSNGGVGSSGDFPAVANLFLEQPKSRNSAYQLDGTLNNVVFGKAVVIHTVDYSLKKKQLFSDYHPVALGKEENLKQKGLSRTFWYVTAGVVFLVLCGLVFLVARAFTNRRLKKYKETHYD